ncbi:hypothetical protein D3C84_740050 [compost metagenome]
MEPLQRRLLANAWNARNIVGLIAHETFQVDNLLRHKAIYLMNDGRRIAFDLADTLSRNRNRHLIGSKLQHIFVAGDDKRLSALLVRHSRQRPDNIVGFIAGQLELADAERLQQLLNKRELLR